MRTNMVDYRHMRNNVEQHLGNTMSTTSLHYLWTNHRGTVLRIQALAMVAIIFSFVLVVYGSCRRWSNCWIIQKGFLAAQVVSLSLGTYCIGVMQSSSVKSEMYPVWAVSLLTLFGCMDPVTSYKGLDYKSPLLKVIFQLCLYCGYVVLISVSSISCVAGHIAIGVLSAITFIKGFHRSLALILPSRKRNQLEELQPKEPDALGRYNGIGLEVHVYIRHSEIKYARQQPKTNNSMGTIHFRLQEKQFDDRLKVTASDKTIIEDVCLSYCLSHLLERRFLGLDTAREMEDKRNKLLKLFRTHPNIDYKRTLKVIEVELAFLYEIFFTSNEFIHYYEAKTSSFWALASFIGICFVGVATAIPGILTSGDRGSTSSTGPGAGTTIVVGTTTADRIVTLVILVSMALLQLVQLFRCWMSNWARVGFAYEYATTAPREKRWPEDLVRSSYWWWWMRLKALVVTRMNWFDNKYLWQDKLGQYSLAAEIKRRDDESCRECLRIVRRPCCSWICGRLAGMLGLQYIAQVLRELWANDAKGGAAVRLHEDVKTSIADFLGQMSSTRIGKEWCSSFVDNGLPESHLPFRKDGLRDQRFIMSQAYSFTEGVMVWHIATWYCEQAEQEKQQSKEEEAPGCSDTAAAAADRREKDRCVAIALSRYCTYLVVSAPELLPGRTAEIKRVFDRAVDDTRKGLADTDDSASRKWKGLADTNDSARGSLILTTAQGVRPSLLDWEAAFGKFRLTNDVFLRGVYFGKVLRDEMLPPPGCTRRRRSDNPWEVLARLWVQTLLYAAPYGDVEAHRQHLSQGGEFITHLWALLYHLGFDRWEHDDDEETKTKGKEAEVSSSIQ